MNHFTVLMQFLRDRPKFFETVQSEKYLHQTALSLLICSSCFFALYGMILGSFSGGLQILVSAVKLPALYLLTLAICLPALFFFEVVAGSKRTFLQYLVLLLASMGVIGVMLLGFAPVTLFFRLSLNDYAFFQLLNIVILGVGSVIGVQVFYRGMLAIADSDGQELKRRRTAMKLWLFLYAFVGSQLGWTLRPFFGNPGQPFQLFRSLESNFFLHVLHLFGDLLGL
ncbi:actin-binding WH2 domain-containing protein [Spirulina major CS-329]|uniref:actin-binding WH2 domain-containing protein n=1 Tax=Spirulina TaxID=1154 RepID=UPI00232E0240|nr:MULTISPECIES: actin-binding WH2 domain-containing protein [Spirulina]MDB9493243.1 actin-binding WH2 domain-containing protein [Spirulina subsalsa CS-330]MDB9503331.1 actin-binding WH2 domain-containing protein [Spirulina major CS-329]